MIPGSIEKNLGLIFKPAKSARVNDPGAIALVFGAKRGWRLRMLPARGFAGLLRVGREAGKLVFNDPFAGSDHGILSAYSGLF